MGLLGLGQWVKDKGKEWWVNSNFRGSGPPRESFRESSRKLSQPWKTNIWEESCYHHIKCIASNELASFMEKWHLNSGNSAHSCQQNFQEVLMGQASKGFSIKSTGGRLEWKAKGLYKEVITMKKGDVIWKGKTKGEDSVFT